VIFAIHPVNNRDRSQSTAFGSCLKRARSVLTATGFCFYPTKNGSATKKGFPLMSGRKPYRNHTQVFFGVVQATSQTSHLIFAHLAI
jgi:hypothetical protein